MKPNTVNFNTGILAAVLFACATTPAQAQTEAAPAAAPPPVTQQAPLPAPALPLPKGERALRLSPSANEVRARLGDKPLTINDVVSLALSTNRDLALAVSSLSETEGQKTTARAGLGPTLGTGYTFTRYNQAQNANLGGQPITTQNQNNSQYTASLNLPIDIAGQLRAASRQAQFQEIAARLDVNRVRNEIVMNTKNAFYDVLRNQALVTVAQNNLQNSVDRLEDATQRLAAGTVARYDVLSAQTDVATARRTLIQNRTTLSLSLTTLNNTLGIDIATRLQLTTEGAVEVPSEPVSTVPLPAPQPAAAADENRLTGTPGQKLGDAGAGRAGQAQNFVVSDPVTIEGGDGEFDALKDEALRTRAEILREDATIAAAKKGITVARSGLLPSLSAGYQYSYSPNATAFAQKETGSAVVTLNLPLFDSGAARGRVRTARAQVAMAETNRRTQIDTVTLEVRQAYLNLRQNQEKVSAARQQLAQADEAYRLARLRYSAGVTKQAGISPLIELSDAQRTLNQAQSDYVNGLYDYNNSRSTLDRAAGRYSYAGTGDTGYPYAPAPIKP